MQHVPVNTDPGAAFMWWMLKWVVVCLAPAIALGVLFPAYMGTFLVAGGVVCLGLFSYRMGTVWDAIRDRRPEVLRAISDGLIALAILLPAIQCVGPLLQRDGGGGWVSHWTEVLHVLAVCAALEALALGLWWVGVFISRRQTRWVL